VSLVVSATTSDEEVTRWFDGESRNRHYRGVRVVDMELDARTTAAGADVFVDYTQGERGSKGPFYLVFTTATGEERWGYFCGNCETFDNAMDTMGRIECNNCGNVRKPDEWDAAHE
jgi:hypothetical protein